MSICIEDCEYYNYPTNCYMIGHCGNDLYIQRKYMIIDPDGPYLEPINEGKNGGNLLGCIIPKTETICMGFVYNNISRINLPTLRQKYNEYIMSIVVNLQVDKKSREKFKELVDFYVAQCREERVEFEKENFPNMTEDEKKESTDKYNKRFALGIYRPKVDMYDLDDMNNYHPYRDVSEDEDYGNE